MNILMVGTGKAGSFQMRGHQLGAAMGARVTTSPTDADFEWADRVVLIKHAGALWAKKVHQYGKPLIWDALDFWKQPAENGLSDQAARELLKRAIDSIQPTLTIGATGAMAAAADGVSLEHHGRIGLVPTPAREQFKVIGYDGNPTYLDYWGPALTALCAKRGWSFVINPPDLSKVDLLVALRGGQWDGWMCREWKSAVKLTNAVLAGRPVISQDTAAWRETAAHGSCVESTRQLPNAVDGWVDWQSRQDMVDDYLTREFRRTAESMAKHYHKLLSSVTAEVTC